MDRNMFWGSVLISLICPLLCNWYLTVPHGVLFRGGMTSLGAGMSALESGYFIVTWSLLLMLTYRRQSQC